MLASVLGLGSGGPYYFYPNSVGQKSVTFLQEMGKEAGERGLVCLGKKEDKRRVGGQTLTQEFCQNSSVGQLSFMGPGSASWFQVNRDLRWKLL